MEGTMESAEKVAGEIVAGLERAWNAGDHGAWAAQFAEDADFVTVRGDYFRTRSDIAGGHHAIFGSIYKGSVNQYELLRTRAIGESVVVAHVRARLQVPAGPMAGEHVALFSAVIVRQDEGWRIVSFHNTFRNVEQLAQDFGLDRWQDHAADARQAAP